MSKKQPECPAGAPAWMATFSDMMTLLLTFFVLLLSFSTTEVAKFRSAMASLKGALGVSQSMVTLSPNDPSISFEVSGNLADDPVEESFEEVMEQLSELADVIDSLEIEEQIEFEIKDDGILISVSTEMLFKLGSAELDPKLYTVLFEIGKIAAMGKDEIFVDGHTDDLPISTAQYPSNWELSGARAASVVRFFIDKNKIDPTRLFLRGFGEYSPRVPNDSVENRQQNRRVEIFIKKNIKKDKDLIL